MQRKLIHHTRSNHGLFEITYFGSTRIKKTAMNIKGHAGTELLKPNQTKPISVLGKEKQIHGDDKWIMV